MLLQSKKAELRHAILCVSKLYSQMLHSEGELHYFGLEDVLYTILMDPHIALFLGRGEGGQQMQYCDLRPLEK